MADAVHAVEFRHVTKTFGSVVAIDDVSMSLRRGEILALLGENGSGKTTLMNMLAGIYYPDAGTILINGREAVIRSPKDSFAYKIGMIHQHYKLVEVLTAAENVMLGYKLRPGETRASVKARLMTYAQYADLSKKVYNMSVSEKQMVEIVKALFRGADLLILDEPTAVLTPQETDRLFDILRGMQAEGKSIIIITHKLNEVMAISDRVAILRKGRYIATVETAETDQRQLTEMMVGRSVELAIRRVPPLGDPPLLRVQRLTCLGEGGVPVLSDVSFDACGGEILGIAGIAGSGQRQLCEAIAGLYPVHGGSILFRNEVDGVVVDENIVGLKADVIAQKGVSLAFVPEDRLGMGLVANMDMVDNMMLRGYRNRPGAFVDRSAPQAMAEALVKDLEIVTPSVFTPVRRLSGGNVQKVLLGREIHGSPKVLMAAYPVRGLDINSSYRIYDLLGAEKARGAAVLYVGEDLDVLLALCDRVLVLCGGRVSGIVDARTATKEEIGLLMTSLGGEQEGRDRA